MSFSFGAKSGGAAKTGGFGFGGGTNGASTGFGAAKTGFGSPAKSGFGTGGNTGGSSPGFGAAKTGGFGTTKSGGFGTSASGGFGTSSFGAAKSPGFGSSGGFGGAKSPGFGGGGGSGFGTTKSPSGFGGGGGFGANKTSGFGGGGGFGAKSPGTGGFGGGASGGFGKTGGFGANSGGAWGQAGQNSQQQGVGGFRQEQWEGEQKIHEIKLAYAPRIDANSGLPLPEGTANSVENRKYCEFSRWVYNPKLDPRFGLQTALEPAHLGQRRLWQEVNRDNPDPEHLEPGLEVGATALKRRFDDQKNQIASFANYTEEVLSTLAVIDKSSRHVSAKMEELQGKQARLYHKSLVVMRKLELCRLIGTSITPDEQRYRERLDRLVRALQHPNEVIQRLMIVQSQLDRTGGDVYGKDPSPREEEMLVKALEKQRQGLQHLTDILKKDLRDIGIIKKRVAEISHDRPSAAASRDHYAYPNR